MECLIQVHISVDMTIDQFIFSSIFFHGENSENSEDMYNVFAIGINCVGAQCSFSCSTDSKQHKFLWFKFVKSIIFILFDYILLFEITSQICISKLAHDTYSRLSSRLLLISEEKNLFIYSFFLPFCHKFATFFQHRMFMMLF